MQTSMQHVAALLSFGLFLTLLSLVPAGERTAEDPERMDLLAEKATPFEELSDLEPLLEEIDSQRLVLLGEATHGTSEFYSWRAAISRYLIEERGFQFIAVEGDWPGIYEINRYVKQKEGAAGSVAEAMEAIERWPLWLWRNREVMELVEWIREYNDGLPARERVGFYGVDLYAYELAMESVVGYLQVRDESLAGQASEAYSCMPGLSDMQSYLNRVATQNRHCGGDMEQVLALLQDHRPELMRADSAAYFDAEQNATVAINAERHLRANLQRGPQSWNYRASHFNQTASRLLDYYGEMSSGIVWAHNTHIGDASATGMGAAGMLNIGQLAKEEFGSEGVYAIGFGTYIGRVHAARQWEGPREEMMIPDARSGSWESILEQIGLERLFLLFSDPDLAEALREPIPHRAIGVTYTPALDSANNYVESVLPDRYNAFLFLRTTGTLDPLD